MTFGLYAAALLPVAVLGAGFSIPEDNRMVERDGIIRYPLGSHQRNFVFGKHSKMAKRQIDTDVFDPRSGTSYTIELTFGTPGQTVPVIFDTGSGELWVNPICSKSTEPDFCAAQPRFTDSSTFEDLNQQGNITYGTGYAYIEMVSDYVAIGSARVTQQIFGIAIDSAHVVTGILGTGPSLNGWDSPYPYFLDSLAEQGHTNSRAFGLDIKGPNNTEGSVVFGGIDTKRYKGSFIKLPIIPAAESPDGNTRFWIYLDGISVNQPDGDVIGVFSKPDGEKGQPVLLDSGYTLSALPRPIMQKLVAAFPSAQYDSGSNTYIVDCADVGRGGSLDFTFGWKTINVPYDEFIWRPSSNTCILGAFEDDFPVLGDTFLRSAYAVYDWDNRNIHLAQSDYCGSNLVAIGKGPDAVPSIVGECGPKPTSTSSTSTSSTTKPPSATSKPGGSKTSSTAGPTTSSTSTTSSTHKPPFPTGGNSTTTTAGPTKTTLTTTSTTIYTITSCPPTVTSCPAHTVTTEIITKTTVVCPETTATYTIPQTVTCPADGSDGSCPPGSTRTTTYTVTVTPVEPTETRTVPGVTTNPSPSTSTPIITTTLLPTTTKGGNGTVTSTTPKPPVETAGGAKAGLVSGAMAVVAGVMAVLAL
ncbi:hypothetical protein VTH82DRAFT_1579 [Thermothelomyces myriococcoides]